MSSTRRAKDNSRFHQNRYASSAEFERGLLANLVAKRCALVDSPAMRELIWFIHSRSHQEGGLRLFVKQIIERFPGELQTREMAALKLRPGKQCNAEQVTQIRGGFPIDSFTDFNRFPLKGEISPADEFLCMRGADENFTEYRARRAEIIQKANTQPASYPAEIFFELCRKQAESHLPSLLESICLDAESNLVSGPWYFPDLFSALRTHLNDYCKNKRPVFTTTLGQKVAEVLEYTAFSGGLTLMQGEARTGKTFAARAWCEQRPGEARFAEVPPGNDDAGFYRALARALGLGNFLSYKACEIRERVESVLLTKDLLLVLDEAQRLWPQRNLRYGFPHRINWIMTMANAGVPIAMVSTPQFIETQKAIEKSGWNARQLIGRIKHFEPLPAELSHEDLSGVAQAVLPEADTEALRALAIYARNSARYLAAIDAIADRARYLAMKDGRHVATTKDVQRAMKESVIPADSKLQLALATGQALKRGRLSALTADVEAISCEADRPRRGASSPSRHNEFSAASERSMTPAGHTPQTPLIGV